MDNNKIVYLGTGRRKTAIARVSIQPGSGKLTINHTIGEEYLQYNPNYLKESKHPLIILGLENEYATILGGNLFRLNVLCGSGA